MKKIAGATAAASGAANRELQDLQQEIAQARATLAELKKQTNEMRRHIDFDDSAFLVEVNEQLLVSALQSQTDAEEAEHALEQLSKSFGMDTLTQLSNRVQFQERFSYAVASAQRHGTRVAVLFADVDGFKSINDALGHAAGDEVLQHTARCIAGSVRDVDFVFRYGGDEFVVLVTDVAQVSDAALVSQKIAAAVASPFALKKRSMSISLSIGVCVYPDDGLDADALVHCADVAMYRAKRLKVNRPGSVSR